MTDQPPSREDIEAMIDARIEKAAERGARRALQDIGIDAESDWREAQADMRYVRQSRLGAEKVKSWAARGAVTTAVAGFLWLVGHGILAAIKSKTGL